METGKSFPLQAKFDLAIMDDWCRFLDISPDLVPSIHISGTKGKGSTSLVASSILKSAGNRVGTFMSPHLVDIRERFLIDGKIISKDTFLKEFWHIWDALQEYVIPSSIKERHIADVLHSISDEKEKSKLKFELESSEFSEENSVNNVGTPSFFRFLTLLAFSLFSKENLDAQVIEVGIGGTYDATNILKRPIVCGVSSLGLDHQAILGSTIPEIAREKAGIFKPKIPAYTCFDQHPEALPILRKVAELQGTSLSIARPLHHFSKFQEDHKYISPIIGAADHQRSNTSLACELAGQFLSLSSNPQAIGELLRSTHISYPGRRQILDWKLPDTRRQLKLCLDGAHTLESIESAAEFIFLNKCDVIVLNIAKNRDHIPLFRKLLCSLLAYGISSIPSVIFCPATPKISLSDKKEKDAYSISLEHQRILSEDWEQLCMGYGFPCVKCICSDAKEALEIASTLSIHGKIGVTGSLHLVGSVLAVVDSEHEDQAPEIEIF
ncbi:Folylpolyglutamate synthetase like protein [Aduncisulcus paluster]|uniref:tetrahydrofolate synthase n=1 Tax=Aduncisulcus paluster TaxID=2918883 RepID=A0ABQ5K3I7_9EUKA|nr:Folylpolyglutamate synthetase like protein [Aduncisulcus paluster]